MKMRITCQYLSICLAGLLFTACQSNQKKEVNRPKHAIAKQSLATSQEDQIVNLVMNLEEVKRKSARVEKDSKGKRRLETYVETPPTAEDPNYWVKVSEDNGSNLVAYYTFAVHRKSHQISYYDAMQDSLIPLSQWRRETPQDER